MIRWERDVEKQVLRKRHLILGINKCVDMDMGTDI